MATTADKKFGATHPATVDYAVDLLSRTEDTLLDEIRSRARAAGLPDIHVAAPDGRHLTALAAATGARKAVEFGTLAGYSGVCLLRGMGPTGFLHTLEISPEHARVAQDTFERAGLAPQVKIHVGPGAETMRALEPLAPFDLVFLDADKSGYPRYLAWAADHLRVGGVILADNVFLWDHIGMPDGELDGPAAAEARAMRAFNADVVAGGRFTGTLIPTGEGLALGVKVR